MTHQCEVCGVEFQKLSKLIQHRRTKNHWTWFNCETCGKAFNRKDNLDRHLKKHRNGSNHQCSECGRSFSRIDNLARHQWAKHQIGGRKRQVDIAEDNDTSAKRLRIEENLRDFYTITKMKVQRIKKFKTDQSTYRVNFKDIDVTEDILVTLKRLFTGIFEDLTKGAKPEDLIRLVVQTPSLDYPITIPFDRVPTLTPDRFMAEIERVLQSNEDFVIDESLLFEVTHVDMPKGGSRKRCRYVNTDRFLHDKKCILRVQNEDDLCCSRAIVIAKARLDKHEKWNSIRLGKSLQETLAQQLHDHAGVRIGKCGIEEIERFQTVLEGYQIHVVSADHFNSIIYKGPESEKKIYLYLHDDHYDVITSMPAFLSRNYFCTKCSTGYDHKERHKCNNICYACCKIHEVSTDNWIRCDDCNRYFRGPECFALHQKTTVKGNSTCRTISRCTGCKKTINKKINKTHKCGQTYCDVCRDVFDEGHRCYMKPEEHAGLKIPMSLEEELVSDIENAKKYIFFDFECTQDDLVQCVTGYHPDIYGKCQNCLKSNCGSYEHRPNLCVMHKVCTVCMDKTEECEMCGLRERVFSGANTLNDFCEWLFSEIPKL